MYCVYIRKHGLMPDAVDLAPTTSFTYAARSFRAGSTNPHLRRNDHRSMHVVYKPPHLRRHGVRKRECRVLITQRGKQSSLGRISSLFHHSTSAGLETIHDALTPVRATIIMCNWSLHSIRPIARMAVTKFDARTIPLIGTAQQLTRVSCCDIKSLLPPSTLS